MATTTKRGFVDRLLLRKSVEQVQHETETSELKRTLGPWGLVLFGICCLLQALGRLRRVKT